MSRFCQALRSGRVLLMDGAMGTELQRAGIGEDECYELWNLTHPEQVRAIHRAYVFSGAECLLTNTFQANPAVLAEEGVDDRLEDINTAAVNLARSVGGVKSFVVASIGPMPSWLQDLEPLARVLRSVSLADALLLETGTGGSDFLGVFAAETPEGNPEELPVLFSLAYHHNPHRGGLLTTRYGDWEPGRIAEHIRKHRLGVAALGVNCGRDIDMDDIIKIIRAYRQATDLPLFARPNAGTPIRDGQHLVYPHTPAQMAARLPELLEAGVCMVGGCCGTTPEHIAAFRPVVVEWNARHGRPSAGG